MWRGATNKTVSMSLNNGIPFQSSQPTAEIRADSNDIGSAVELEPIEREY
ncbi:hypothetical protein ACPOL_1834 [Acidisarcina polymorpha]|uniref:Uncharacterized protein n=1 Tax=Acidisarcina polymorpha TaxID=2211140 RepID=A0A2Z5FXS9_9BACT|nr:hypothetical protein ACPOL_1834 [Acidisarcina polymorpha]